MLKSINWYLIALSWLYLLSSTVNAQTTTPEYTYRPNPDFPITGLITTPESLQGTINTDTRVTSTTRPPAPPTTTRSTTSSTTSRSTQQAPTQGPPTQGPTQGPPTQGPTQEPPVPPSPPTTTQAPPPPPTQPTQNPPPPPGENVYYSTSTIYTTQNIPHVVHSTLFSTVTFNVPVTPTATDYVTVTEVENTQTINTPSTSYLTITTTIPGSATTSHWETPSVHWSESLTTSTLVIPYPSLSVDISTITNTQIHTYYEPVETVQSELTTSLVVSPNTTFTTTFYNYYTQTNFQQFLTTETLFDYSSSTHTGTQFATLSFTNGLWIGVTDILSYASTLEYPPITQTSTQAFEFIHGLTTRTNFKTVTNEIARTTVYSTVSSYITTTVTEYLQNGETVYPISTITFTFTSRVPTSVTITSTFTPPTPTPPPAVTPVPTQPTVTVSVPSQTATVTSTTSIIPTDCIVPSQAIAAPFAVQETNAATKRGGDKKLISVFVGFVLIALI